jgi:hypothetical protein
MCFNYGSDYSVSKVHRAGARPGLFLRLVVLSLGAKTSNFLPATWRLADSTVRHGVKMNWFIGAQKRISLRYVKRYISQHLISLFAFGSSILFFKLLKYTINLLFLP